MDNSHPFQIPFTMKPALRTLFDTTTCFLPSVMHFLFSLSQTTFFLFWLLYSTIHNLYIIYLLKSKDLCLRVCVCVCLM